MRRKIVALFIAFTCLTLVLPAQKGWEAGAWLGSSFYFGDLNTNFDLSLPSGAGGILFRYNFNNRLSLKFSGNYATVRGDDAVSKNTFERARNLSFRSPLLEGAAQLEFNFLPYIHGSKENGFSPYLFGGLTVFYYDPQANYQGSWVNLRELGTEGQFKGEEYYSIATGLTYGMGLKVDLSYEWSLNFEFGVRQLSTDYLDDVSTVYPDKGELLKNRGQMAVALSDRSIPIPGISNEPIGEEGKQRGSSSTNDAYAFLGVGLVYFFGDVQCPDYGRKRRRR